MLVTIGIPITIELVLVYLVSIELVLFLLVYIELVDWIVLVKLVYGILEYFFSGLLNLQMRAYIAACVSTIHEKNHVC